VAAIRIEDEDRGHWLLWDDGAGVGERAGAERPAHPVGTLPDGLPRVLIVLAGAGFDHARLRAEAARAHAVIAADAGAALCLDAGLDPELVVGDFDSLPPATRARLDDTRLRHAPDPERNDLEKAIELAYEHHGPHAEIVLAAGGMVDGGRMDHAVANLGPLLREPHARISMVDGDGRLFALRHGRAVFEGLAGRTLSVLPWSLRGAQVSEAGVLFPLDRATLQLGGRGVSNQVDAEQAVVSVHDGVALVWVER
jgi:thiamine pyrophosphokinase